MNRQQQITEAQVRHKISDARVRWSNAKTDYTFAVESDETHRQVEAHLRMIKARYDEKIWQSVLEIL